MVGHGGTLVSGMQKQEVGLASIWEPDILHILHGSMPSHFLVGSAQGVESGGVSGTGPLLCMIIGAPFALCEILPMP